MFSILTYLVLGVALAIMGVGITIFVINSNK